MVVIRESDMCFGEYTEEQVFVIEKSTQYYEKLRPNPFHDVFTKILQDEMKIWKIPSFSIINEDMAREKHFIL